MVLLTPLLFATALLLASPLARVLNRRSRTYRALTT
jgi:hypothetical protein